jgi:hypothetical protein
LQENFQVTNGVVRRFIADAILKQLRREGSIARIIAVDAITLGGDGGGLSAGRRLEIELAAKGPSRQEAFVKWQCGVEVGHVCCVG